MRLLACITCLVSVACGDDDKVRRLPDAPPQADAAIDAPTSGLVSLSIHEGTMPRVGVRVLFQNADSSVVSETTTGTDGRASATMEPGGYVTAIDPFVLATGGQDAGDLRTFAGVKPGDALRLFQSDFSQTAVTITVTLPVDPNAAAYAVSTNCLFFEPVGVPPTGGNPTAQITMSGCPATGNLLALAYDANGDLISSIYKPSVVLADNATVDLSADTFAAVPDSSFTYANLPSDTGAVSVFGARATAVGKIYSFNTYVTAAGGSATGMIKIPPISNGTAVTLSTLLGSTRTQHVIGEWGPITASYVLDPSGLLLPGYDAPPTLDVAGHAIRWMSSGGAAQPDFSHVRAFLNRDLGTSTMRWTWEIVAPSSTAVVLPVLPNGSPHNPMTGDFASYQITTGKVPGGYDAVRETILAVENLQEIAVGAAGKASFALYVEAEARVRPERDDTPPRRGFTRRAR